MSTTQKRAVVRAVRVFTTAVRGNWKVIYGRGNRFVPGAVTIAARPGRGDGVYGSTWSTVQGELLLSGKVELSREMGDNYRTWVHVALHELGHAVGVEHSGDRANVTYPRVRMKALWQRYTRAEVEGMRMLTKHTC